MSKYPLAALLILLMGLVGAPPEAEAEAEDDNWEETSLNTQNINQQASRDRRNFKKMSRSQRRQYRRDAEAQKRKAEQDLAHARQQYNKHQQATTGAARGVSSRSSSTASGPAFNSNMGDAAKGNSMLYDMGSTISNVYGMIHVSPCMSPTPPSKACYKMALGFAGAAFLNAMSNKEKKRQRSITAPSYNKIGSGVDVQDCTLGIDCQTPSGISVTTPDGLSFEQQCLMALSEGEVKEGCSMDSIIKGYTSTGLGSGVGSASGGSTSGLASELSDMNIDDLASNVKKMKSQYGFDDSGNIRMPDGSTTTMADLAKNLSKEDQEEWNNAFAKVGEATSQNLFGDEAQGGMLGSAASSKEGAYGENMEALKKSQKGLLGKEIRGVSSTLDKTKLFSYHSNGEKVGTWNDNIFKMMTRRYQVKIQNQSLVK